MAFAKPNFTRKEVSRAGSILISYDASVDQRIAAMETLNLWRSCHAYPINTFQATLRMRLKKVGGNHLVAQRLKRTPSIIKKLQLNTGMQMVRMQDIGGLRAVVDTLTQVRKLQNLYTKNSLTHELIGVDDYIKCPKSSGYRSLHLIYKYKNLDKPIYDGLCIEIQIRTKLQHAWATAVETIGTFLEQSLKSSEGSQVWLDYFKLVREAFAELEKSPMAKEYAHESPVKIFRNVLLQTKQLDVKNKLTGFAVAANAIKTEQSKGSYHLIILNAKLQSVVIQSFGKKRLDEANSKYIEVEQNNAENNSSIQVVLVSTNSIEALRKAYPNYFLDTRQFSNALLRIERMLQHSSILEK